LAESPGSGRPERLFHLVQPKGWAEADRDAPWAPSSLASEGFVHLSFPHQLLGTLDAHFDGTDELWLFEVDPESVADDLVLEASRGGALFPHLYRALGREEVLGHWRLTRALDGAWSLPLWGPSADADGPRRVPGPPHSP
jgi:uncharacterized protein (DUF952 family)